MMCEISMMNASRFNGGLMTRKEKKRLSKVIGGKPAKNPSTVKSIFSLGLKFSEWINGRMYLGLVKLGPFYREFRVGLLVRCR